MDHYILDDDGEPQRTTDVRVWGEWMDRATRLDLRRVASARDEAAGRDGVLVSTVFLGLDHAFSGGPPVLWETLVFGGPLDGEMDRYTSRAAALRGHQAMCERVAAAQAVP